MSTSVTAQVSTRKNKSKSCFVINSLTMRDLSVIDLRFQRHPFRNELPWQLADSGIKGIIYEPLEFLGLKISLFIDLFDILTGMVIVSEPELQGAVAGNGNCDRIVEGGCSN